MNSTKTLLPLVRIVFRANNKGHDKVFNTCDAPKSTARENLKRAVRWYRSLGKRRRDVSVYLIEKVNGTWSTDWKLSEGGEILPHPWKESWERHAAA